MATSGKGHDQLRRQQITGLLILLLGIVVFSIWRAGFGQVFPHRWWHIW